MLYSRKLYLFCLQYNKNYLPLKCVFHIIRFKVNKRLEYSGTPFFMPISKEIKFL